MTPNSAAITGIGSVSPYGTLAGLIPPGALEPEPITAWPTSGLRRAFLVKPFRPASVVPGLKTRRLDRLSAWAMVASSLAIQDAGIDLSQEDRSRVAVVFGTGFGCAELTEAFFQSAAAHGWAGTDPSPFPEGLANAPASHVALWHEIRGPNITIGCKCFAGESALIQAASLLRQRQADLAIVLAGDTLTRAVYEWYEASGLLSPACSNSDPVADGSGFVPSEGVAALVLEPAGRRDARAYAHFSSGSWSADGDAGVAIRQMLGGSVPSITICAGNGAPCATSCTSTLAGEICGTSVGLVPAQAAAAGLTDTGALLHLILALSNQAPSGQALLLGTSGENGYSALLLELP
ncbi:MAG TPA: beta-ketoacyl synthase N-terminal-like domain-containing protein [Candidatus Sulfotelmatobacter sp.]|nr:beta-ketoacyl synthase N-terminal-like domain-containing protein [Candidatus Sulfotelmatobacter sp.]